MLKSEKLHVFIIYIYYIYTINNNLYNNTIQFFLYSYKINNIRTKVFL